MAQTETTKRFITLKKRVIHHLEQLKRALPPALDHAFDRYFEREVSRYLKIEAQLDRFQTLILKLGDEVQKAETLFALRQAAGRVSYVADRIDELEAALYRRSRRRGRLFNLGDFFKHFSQESRNGTADAKGEVHSLSEAYRILKLEEGCSLSEVTAAFRRLAKVYHPDARGGDRSDEQHLRRVVEAYQMIKEAHAE